MFRKLFSVALALVAVLCVNAQPTVQLTPLPLNPKVKTGVLPNGLTYYVMHNEEPKERANFYIAQKVGSTLENQDQLGLAHFLEHMAFNGLKHFPGKSMLNYLQNKGVRFGSDINAYTSFDETVYNINNVPTTDQALMDSVLLVLHDWSGDILLEEAEIDAERGVIREEWRQRNDASNRMFTSILPQIYDEYQYQQMPIGKMEVVMNFKPEVLRAYYKKWYRPDQQGIVIVGDFDAAEMEKKVIELFSTIPMPENAAPRVYPAVSDNKEPIYASFTDPELQQPQTIISFKSEKVPFEQRNTVEMYVNNGVLQSIISMLINTRLSENAQNPDCQYAGASVSFGDYYVSKTKDAFEIGVVPKKETQPAVAEALAIVARACKTGFTESELDRVRTNMLSSFERMYNERDKRSNDAFGKELYRFFIDNEPAPGIEIEYQLMQQVLPNIPVDAINTAVKGLMTTDNMVIVTAVPEKEGFKIESKEVLLNTITSAMNAEYEAYVDEKITEPLIAQLPKPGKVVATKTNDQLGTTELTLSNGIKVVVKPTDFAADQISLTAYRPGGVQQYSTDQATNVKLMDNAFMVSKMGPFDNKTLRKYLTGKHASVGFKTNNFTDVVSGASTVKDLPTMMELLYTAFTNVNEDPTMFGVMIDQAKLQLKNAEANPNTEFSNRLNKDRYPNNPILWNLTMEDLEKVNYTEALNLAKAALSNPADYTFIFVGNVDIEALKPLLEQYVASLPVKAVDKLVVKTPYEVAKGQVVDHFQKPMQAPSTTVYDLYSDNNVPFNQKNYIMTSMIGDILDIIYTATLREEEGGTYGASVSSALNPSNGCWDLMYIFQTNKDQQQSLIDRAQAELMKLLNDGAKAEDFNKVKEAMIKQYEIAVRNNGYWSNNLMTYLRGYDLINGYKEAIESVTLADLNAFMKKFYNGKNRIQVIMEGTPAE